MRVARHSKKVRSKSKSLRGGYQGVLIGKKNKYRKHLNKSKRKSRRQSKRAKVYKLNKKEVKLIMNLIYQVYFKDKIESNKKDAVKEVELLEKLHKLLVNFEVMTTKPKLQGTFGVIDLSKKDGVYHFCLNELEGYLAFDRKETNLIPLKKHQKKGSPMKGGGYINYTFDLSSRISNMPPVMREYIP